MKRKLLLTLCVIAMSVTMAAAIRNIDLPGYGTVSVDLYYLDATATGIAGEDNEPMQYAFSVYYCDNPRIAVVSKVWEQFTDSQSNVVLPQQVTIAGKTYPVVGIWSTDKLFAAEGLGVQQLDAKLASVALASGFTNETSFFRVFKAITGLTPKEWLARHGSSQ